jgi:hypothetical protein
MLPNGGAHVMGDHTLVGFARALAGTLAARPPGLVRRVRDLSLVPLTEDTVLVVACDSVGAIGPKPGDAVSAEGETVGYFAARVPLLEVLCAGAVPLLVVDALMVELEPTGSAILAGVRRACREAGLDEDAAVTGSTEENVPTNATGVGVMVLGVAPRASLYPGAAQSGDGLYLLGVPKSAPTHAVVMGDPEMVAMRAILDLRSHSTVHDLLPVGSRGAAWEAGQLAASAGLRARLELGNVADGELLRRSGGPATAVLVAAAVPPTVPGVPLRRIGVLE